MSLADHQHRKFDPAHMDRLDSPERRAFHDPESIVHALPLQGGERVADVGCGTGYFAVPLARRVGREGKVWALDIEPLMLERVRQKAAEHELSQLETVHSDENRLPLPEECADLVFMANVLHEATDRERFLEEAVRILRVGGVLAVVEWRTDLPQPPEKGPPLAHRLGREEGGGLIRAQGLQEVGDFPAGPQHWGALFRKR